MCGIFGIVLAENSGITPQDFKSTASDLFRLSEARGKESAGLAMLNGGPICVYKSAASASRMIRNPEYKKLLDDVLNSCTDDAKKITHPLAFIGHSRLVTNGAQEQNDNNQPIIAAGMVGVHNGIIVNDDVLFDEFPDLERRYEVDTEVLLRLIRHFVRREASWSKAIQAAFARIQGNASVAILFEDLDRLLLATNNGSLYHLSPRGSNLLIFASERYILQTAASKGRLRNLLGDFRISHVEPWRAHLIKLSDLSIESFSLNDEESSHPEIAPCNSSREIKNLSTDQNDQGQAVSAYNPLIHTSDDDEGLLHQHQHYVKRLRRCSRCILPETMPNIEFDEDGVCNYCRSYVKTELKGEAALKELVAPFRNNRQEPDCVVALSGGRDSSYCLHYVKNVLELTPITYTYDWGMVTDIARRNVARMCGKLGVEHILVSADIRWKRRNIAKNVRAWLKRPALGMIPLFMAGDKQYFYFANKLRRQTGIHRVLLGSNPLETTGFKHGFANTASNNRALGTKAGLIKYYGTQFLKNPAYLNSTIPDTIFAYYAYYLMPCPYIDIYEYKLWEEEEVNSTLINEYDWEVAKDTVTTWRIGDGTAAFYNYIYHCIAGISEIDTFRSNQIREGMIDRASALELAERENQPRHESIKWYLGVIGMGDEFNHVIRTINAAPKLYRTDN
ncbi:MAG: hypothetical protein MI923_23185 [Phycisphaerales bacterium]|nr:hypothetical protein [Phycisphaerales bacterium]